MKTLLFILISAVACHAEITNPVEDFLKDMKVAMKGNKIMILVTDLNRTGRPEVWLSSPAFVNGKAGEIWRVYRNTAKGFVAYEKPVVFRSDFFTVREISEKKSELLSFQPGGAGSGIVVAFSWNGDVLEERTVAKITDEETSKEYTNIEKSNWRDKVKFLEEGEASKFKLPFK